MSDRTMRGRHRAQSRPSTPLTQFTSTATAQLQTVGRRTAVVAASSGLVVSAIGGAAPAYAGNDVVALPPVDAAALAASAKAQLDLAPVVTAPVDAAWTVDVPEVTAVKPAPPPPPPTRRSTATTSRSTARAVANNPAPASVAGSAVLVVGGWGSSCCDAANDLHAVLPATPMRQFSYQGLNARGKPIPSGANADDIPLPELGDRIAAQVRALSAAAKRPVAVVAESEGTLGVYAMLARNPGLPISAVVLLSPIVSPGQLSYPPDDDGATASEAALNELNHLVGGMSPYGTGGAQDLLNSVSKFGAQYFADMIAAAGGGAADQGGRGGAGTVAGADGKPIRVLAVVPLADAVTLPQCALPPSVIVVPAFHGGLLGDSAVLPMVSSFLAGHDVTSPDDGQLHDLAELITGAAAPWRMPDTGAACPFAAG